MKTISTYLNFTGNTEEAFNFYKSVFGGEFLSLQRYKDQPEGEKLSESDREKILHISLDLGKGNILMAADAIESMGHTLDTGNNFSLIIGTDNEAEADKLFKNLSLGGQVNMQMTKTFWGAYFGMLTDKFGIQWMVNYEYNQPK
jgi:PhnB protein